MKDHPSAANVLAISLRFYRRASVIRVRVRFTLELLFRLGFHFMPGHAKVVTSVKILILASVFRTNGNLTYKTSSLFLGKCFPKDVRTSGHLRGQVI